MQTIAKSHRSPCGDRVTKPPRGTRMRKLAGQVPARLAKSHVPKARSAVFVLCVCLVLNAISMATNSTKSWAGLCDPVPTDIKTTDYFLHFTLPAGLMPDKRFDNRPAQLQVHRVEPVYYHKCDFVPNRAAVLIHGRSVSGPPTFDLQYFTPFDGKLSIQEALAWAGIDTFVPNLLGYSPSTTFEDGLDDPGNASLLSDHTNIPLIFPLGQQEDPLAVDVNPLGGHTRPHSSKVRFARTDVWVHDIRQVIDDAITKARPSDGKVTLVGHSLGALRVGRALYKAKFPDIVAKVNRVVFTAPFFGAPTEETPPAGGFATFPLTVIGRDSVVPPSPGHTATVSISLDDLSVGIPPERAAVCDGYQLPGTREQMWDQMMDQETVGRGWGGNDPNNPTGLVRLPTFSNNGFNPAVAGQLSVPTLVMQGLDDTTVPGTAPAIYNALPASMTNKVLVQIHCATHEMFAEGCFIALRCFPDLHTPYGGVLGLPWGGPHTTIKAALIEWITRGTFNGAKSGKFIVDSSGVANASGP
jgi:alpha-beta hydrolase superfamily lysophospholipase